MQGKGSAAPLKISAGNNLVPVGVCQAVSTQPSATARAQKNSTPGAAAGLQKRHPAAPDYKQQPRTADVITAVVRLPCESSGLDKHLL